MEPKLISWSFPVTPTNLIADFPLLSLLLKIVLELVLDDLQCTILQPQYFDLSSLLVWESQRINKTNKANICLCFRCSFPCIISLKNKHCVSHILDTFALSSRYWRHFSGSFISNRLSFIRSCILCSNSFLAFLISSRRNPASFREAWEGKQDVSEGFYLYYMCARLRCDLVGVAGPLIHLSEVLQIFLCLCYFLPRYMKLFFKGQLMTVAWEVGVEPQILFMTLVWQRRVQFRRMEDAFLLYRQYLPFHPFGGLNWTAGSVLYCGWWTAQTSHSLPKVLH